MGRRVLSAVPAFVFEHSRNTNFRLGFRGDADRRSDSRGVALHRVAVSLALQSGPSLDTTGKAIWFDFLSGARAAHVELSWVLRAVQRHSRDAQSSENFSAHFAAHNAEESS